MEFNFLLIEDNVIDQLVTTQLLKKNFDLADVTIANNGKEALQWFHDHEIGLDDPLIILLDIRMPEMDGFEFLSEYEKLPDAFKRKTQIFMLSSTLDSEDIQRAENNTNVQCLLGKPFPVNEFKKLICKE